MSGGEMQLEHDLKIPAPLDPHIASISIRTGSNNPADSFDLLLSATFGSDYVVLEAGSEEIEVRISVMKAEIKLDGINCQFHLIGPSGVEPGAEAWTGTQTSVQRKTNSSGRNIDLGLSLSPGLRPEVNASVGIRGGSSAAAEATIERSRANMPFRILGADIVQVGHPDAFDVPMHGRIIDENIAVRVTPTERSKRVGVLARIRVRERWISVKDARTESANSPIQRFLSSIRSNSSEDEKRKELFQRLLAHLVAIQLQEESERKDATLAASALVFSPISEQFGGLALPKARDRLRIDLADIERFLNASDSERVGLLRSIGVDISEAEEDFNSRFLRAWNLDGLHYRGVYYDSAEYLQNMKVNIEASIGLKTSLISSGAGARFIDLQVTDEPCPTRSAKDLATAVDIFHPQEPISVGYLLKGQRAYNVARVLGFNLSYSTFLKRIRPRAHVTGYGNLVTIADLFSLFCDRDAVNLLPGMILRFSPEFFFDEIEFEADEPDSAVNP